MPSIHPMTRKNPPPVPLTGVAPVAAAVRVSGLLVLQTYYVVPKNPLNAPFYELHLAPDAKAGAKRTVLVTRDGPLYDRALDSEGTDARFDVTFHHGTTAARRPCSVLVSLEPAIGRKELS